MYWIYSIYNEKYNKLYIGQTSDLKNRLELHRNKKFKTSFTSRFDGSWKLIYSEEASNRTDALLREKQLKSYRGREFLRGFIKPL